MRAPSAARLDEALGGRAGVARLVSAFFSQMQRRPSAAGIRALHGPDLGPIERKLSAYLYQQLRTGGGRSSASILPLAHFRFSIGPAERDEWLECMRAALRETSVDEAAADALMRELSVLADLCRSDGDGDSY